MSVTHEQRALLESRLAYRLLSDGTAQLSRILIDGESARRGSIACLAVLACMPFRPPSGTFGPALRPGSSTGVLHHVMVRGTDLRALAAMVRMPPPSTC